ncbi:energy transducer TonB [Xanthomonas graminis]|uniref:protein tonB n=1 Tax=Xanthomonas graminis TaxID=3390026 RepID=UPI0025402B17|nr:protein tonB [Xanthomonas translucens]
MHRKSGLTTWRWGGLLLALLAATAFATATGSGPGAVRKQVESSLLVTGKIDIEPDGTVSALAIDHADKLPEGVLGFVRASVQRWTFEPALRDGKPVPARTPVTLRLVAKRQQGDRDQVEIRHASFAAYDPKDPRAVTSIRTPPPAYPEAAYRVGASGSAYLVLNVARDGSVADAAVEQVNLRIVASESEMQKLREIFARSALAAARKWRFRRRAKARTCQRRTGRCASRSTIRCATSPTKAWTAATGTGSAMSPVRARVRPGTPARTHRASRPTRCRPAACTWSTTTARAC